MAAWLGGTLITASNTLGQPGGGLGGGRAITYAGAGGGYGTSGGDASDVTVNNTLISGQNSGGSSVSATNLWEALQKNSFTPDIIQFGAGGAGSRGSQGSTPQTSAPGGDGGILYTEIVPQGTLTTQGRSVAGAPGSSAAYPVASSTFYGFNSGSGAGGLWLGIASRIVYGSGTINAAGGSSSTVGSGTGGAGGNGRVVQLYFDAFASNLSVTNGVQDQFRLLYVPPPIGPLVS